MSPVIRLSPEIYSRLEKHAVGFDNPTNVIEKLLNFYEKEEHNPEIKPITNNDASNSRLFSNKEIQQKITHVAKSLPVNVLENFCKEFPSKEVFGLSFPLFIRLPIHSNEESKRSAVQTEDGVNRWTWKYEFEKEGFIYAICTQWYPKNDKGVQKWLQKNTANK